MNVSLSGAPRAKAYVVCTVFPDARKSAKRVLPLTVVLDPRESSRAESIEVSTDEIIRMSLANTICFLGFTNAALSLLRRESLGEFAAILRQEPLTVDGSQYIPIARADNGWTFVYDIRVARALLQMEERPAEPIESILSDGGYDLRFESFARDRADQIILGMGFGMIRVPPERNEARLTSRGEVLPQVVTEAEADRFRDAIAYTCGVRGELPTESGLLTPHTARLVAVTDIIVNAGGSEAEAIALLLRDVIIGDEGRQRLTDVRNRFGETIASIAECAAEYSAPSGTRWVARQQADGCSLSSAEPSGLLISAAEHLYDAQQMLRELQSSASPSLIWERLNATPDEVLRRYRTLIKRFVSAVPDARRKHLVQKLARIVDSMESLMPMNIAKQPAPVQVVVRGGLP